MKILARKYRSQFEEAQKALDFHKLQAMGKSSSDATGASEEAEKLPKIQGEAKGLKEEIEKLQSELKMAERANEELNSKLEGNSEKDDGLGKKVDELNVQIERLNKENNELKVHGIFQIIFQFTVANLLLYYSSLDILISRSKFLLSIFEYLFFDVYNCLSNSQMKNYL